MAQARRRRLAAGINGLDSSSPSDSNSDEEVEILRRQRRDEELIASIHNADEERLLATMRANIAASKRVPSKEAIASIEKLDVNDLSEDQRSKQTFQVSRRISLQFKKFSGTPSICQEADYH